MREKIKNNLAGFILGAIIFSAVGVVAATMASSDVEYTNSKNSSVTNAKEALDDLYEKSSEITYVYSQQTGMSKTTAPTNGLSSNSSYSNGDVYIKTTLFRGYAVGHSACLKYNNKEFCMEPNYRVNGDTDGSQTKSKLQTAMESALGTSASSCSYDSDYASCIFGSTSCIITQFSLDEYTSICYSNNNYQSSVYSNGETFYGASGSGND